MKLLIRLVLIIFFVALITVNVSFAGGLSTHFVQVNLNKLELNKEYSVKKEKGEGLVVRNTTKDVTVNIKIDVEKPAGETLIEGYEPIPDLSWVKIAKDYFEQVGPGDSIETDIIIYIPMDERYYGKRYQVYIYSHTEGNNTFRVGLMSRILLEIVPEPMDSN